MQASLDELNDPSLAPARVTRQERTRWRIATEDGERDARAAGRLRGERPVTGDWVAGHDDGLGGWAIHAILPRRGAIARRAAGDDAAEQVVAANVDVLLAVAALDAPLNARRLERVLALAHGGGAQPVVVLTKADASADPDAARREADSLGAPVLVTSARTGLGLDALRDLARPARTLALVGVSGAGKSSIVNALLGEERLATGEVRAADAKGRHTTTWRELVPLPGGGALLDTPGLREVGLVDAAGLAGAYEEIDALAQRCRFRDCAHDTEPGCAVRGAVEPARLEGWRKLQREAARAMAKRDEAFGRRLREASMREIRARTREGRDNVRRKRGEDDPHM
jgi:ribosome biogenesis GTPase